MAKSLVITLAFPTPLLDNLSSSIKNFKKYWFTVFYYVRNKILLNYELGQLLQQILPVLKRPALKNMIKKIN